MKERTREQLLYGPSVVLLGLITALPVVALIYFSFRHLTGYAPSLWAPSQPTLSNFDILSDPIVIRSFLRTAEYAVLSVSTEIIVGVSVALFISRYVRHMIFVVRLLTTPIITSPLAVAMLWKLMFSMEGGWVNNVMRAATGREIAWLSLSPFNLPLPKPLLLWLNMHSGFLVLVAADVWQWTPMVILVVLARLLTIPTSLTDAAAIDGLRSSQIARSILLPILRPTIVVLLILRVIDSLKVFETIWALFGDNDSAVSVTSMIVRYTLLVRDYGRGAALAIVFVIGVIILLLIVIRSSKRWYLT